jgi:antitoxin component of MazEF toxin-antitoxin module
MKVCEHETRKIFKIGDTLAITIPAKMREKYYNLEEGDEVNIGVFSSDKGFHYSFWKNKEE